MRIFILLIALLAAKPAFADEPEMVTRFRAQLSEVAEAHGDKCTVVLKETSPDGSASIVLATCDKIEEQCYFGLLDEDVFPLNCEKKPILINIKE